ncbi:SpaA isopeptide-forming pilin-related protein [Curtanaerobium respiraculi]|uniref:SpaA isopeptide-forming pilin-related protein n=1 Tax=Curtanaerobium respiraculi TaxID=2949669 RepID=UPI0024B38CDE|nr:SpaA isopeptide-forming pilin-related protein [Curtanaerobium respiraculi]
MKVTATVAGENVLPKDAVLDIAELTPYGDDAVKAHEAGGEEAAKADDDAERYVDATAKVAEHVGKDEKNVIEARAYDVRFLDSVGNEIEPNGTVSVAFSYKQKVVLDGAETDSSNVEVAHVKDDGQVELVDATITSDHKGALEKTEFHAQSFSIYVVFDTGNTSNTAPYNVGEYGWIRFGGDNWKVDSLPADPGFDNAGWARYLKVNVYTLNSGGNSANPNDYSLKKSFEHLATWASNYTIETSQFSGTVRMTSFRKAHSTSWQQYNGLQNSYASEVYYTTWHPYGFDGDINELNIYLDKGETPLPPTPSDQTGTTYIIRYYHADGSYDQKDGVLTSGQSISFDQAEKLKAGEVHSGVSVTAGPKAANVNETNCAGTISYDAGTRLVKVNVYYKTKVEKETGGTVTGAPQYDAEIQNGTKVYDTSREGLHTDKTASVHVDGSGISDGRTFDLKLESWNIGTNMANVGMVFDASGSMVWTSNNPDAMTHTQGEWTAIMGSGYTPYRVLTEAQVDKILDKNATDNSKLNYNGYKYYLYDRTAGVNEYVPMGYSNGTHQNVGGIELFKMNGQYMARAINHTGAGWYYVNSGGYPDYATQQPYSAKQYVGVQGAHNYNENESQNDFGGAWHPIQGTANGSHANYFYIDDAGNLKTCFFYNGVYRISQVYSKADDASTKSEVLQHSVGKFAETLNSLSPESQVSMVRFSRSDFSSTQLALLNWTNDTAKMTAAMNQSYGDTETQGGSAHAWLGGMDVYNYGFTGATHTYKGIKAFMEKMTSNQAGSWGQQGYTPNTTNGAASRYLIIFTDGKDNSGNENQAIADATTLKNNGYTIMTVLMESAGMTQDDITHSTNFLKELASTKPNSSEKYFYSARYDNGEDLVAHFQEMATQIAEPLQGYTVTDYIDPRFDLVDADGNVLTVLNENGGFTERPYQLADGKTATLKYDSDKKMFYLEWTDQEIPTTTQGVTGEQKVSVWSSTITVRAKEDFLGGNDILSNGNEAGQNRVYNPADPNNSPHKYFPWTSVNPEVLDLAIGNYEDTIFMGEDITPDNLYDKVAGSADSTWFVEYLARIDAKNNQDYLGRLKNGETVTVDYYYLPKPGDATSYAGGNCHQNDKVGGLTYKWVADNTGGNNPSNAYEPFTTTTTNDVKYHLEVTYTPDRINYGSPDPYANNGTPRTRSLTNLVNQNPSTWLIRDPVGSEQTATVSATGKAVIHVVDGRILVQKRVNKENLLGYLSTLGDDGEMTFTFNLKRSYGTTGQDAYRSFQIKLNNSASAGGTAAGVHTVTRADVEAMTSDANGDVVIASQWETDLPIGTYTLTEAISDSDSFATPTFAGVAAADIADDPATTDYVEKPEFAAAFDTDPAPLSFYIGQVHGGIPDQCSYADSDFSTAAVEDTVKQVDPALSANGGKFYLNAQIGMARVTNHPKPGIVILKRDAANHETVLAGAEFKLYATNDAWDEPSSSQQPVATKTTGADGTAAFTSLVDGKYLLYETRAATGYQAPSEPWRITVAGGKVTSFTTSNPSAGVITPENGAYPIDNAKTSELPSAGGSGPLAIYLASVVLLLGAAIGLWRRRRRLDGGEA